MTSAPSPHAHSASVEPIDETESSTRSDLDRFGIRSHPHTSYEWNGFRYSNASDAIAAAKRAGR